MKRFIAKIGLFILPIIVLAILLEISLRSIPNDYRLKRMYLDTHSQEIETLILGSSHSFYGLDPEYFNTNTFNASHISQSLSYDYEILEKYQNQLIHLKTLILPISYFTFFETLESGPEAWRNKNYAIYYDIDLVHSVWDYSEILRNKLDVNIKRWIRYYIKKEPNLTSSSLGWGMNYKVNDEIHLDKVGGHTAKKHSAALDKAEIIGISKLNRDLLKSIQEWCIAKNVELILFTPPAHSSYAENLNAEQLALSLEYMEQICDDTATCRYRSFLNNPLFTKADFYDPDHLSHSGAKKFSQLLNEWIEQK